MERWPEQRNEVSRHTILLYVLQVCCIAYTYKHYFIYIYIYIYIRAITHFPVQYSAVLIQARKHSLPKKCRRTFSIRETSLISTHVYFQNILPLNFNFSPYVCICRHTKSKAKLFLVWFSCLQVFSIFFIFISTSSLVSCYCTFSLVLNRKSFRHSICHRSIGGAHAFPACLPSDKYLPRMPFFSVRKYLEAVNATSKIGDFIAWTEDIMSILKREDHLSESVRRKECLVWLINCYILNNFCLS
jgi:hypothetical protein